MYQSESIHLENHDRDWALWDPLTPPYQRLSFGKNSLILQQPYWPNYNMLEYAKLQQSTKRFSSHTNNLPLHLHCQHQTSPSHSPMSIMKQSLSPEIRNNLEKEALRIDEPNCACQNLTSPLLITLRGNHKGLTSVTHSTLHNTTLSKHLTLS